MYWADDGGETNRSCGYDRDHKAIKATVDPTMEKDAVFGMRFMWPPVLMAPLIKKNLL